MYVVITDRVLCMFAMLATGMVVMRNLDILISYPFASPRSRTDITTYSAIALLMLFNGNALLALFNAHWQHTGVTHMGEAFVVIGALTLLFQYGIEKLSNGNYRDMLMRGAFLATSVAVIIVITMRKI